MKRRYLLVAKPLRQGAYLFHFTRLLQGITAAIIFVLLGSTTYATVNSLPGEKLFKLKKTAENIQVQLTSDPVEKANLQLSFTEKRLAEAQQIIMGPHKNPDQEVAALNELADQTRTAIEEVRTANIQKIDHPTVAKLEDVANKQKELLQQIDEQGTMKNVASSAIAQTQDNQTKIKEVIHIVAVSNEETKAALAPKENTAATSTQESIATSTKTSDIPTLTKGTTSSPSLLTPKKPETTKKPEVAPEETAASTTSPNTAIGTFILEDPANPE